MGYAWNGVCYQDAPAALAAFTEQVPRNDGTAITTFTANPTASGTGLITWSISHRPLTGTAATTRTGTTQLPTCTTEALDQWPVQTLLVVAAVFFAAFIGFRTGYRS